MDNILATVKQGLGIASDYTPFDDELLMLINSVFYTLYQIGIGDKPFIVDSESTWNEFYDDDGVISACKPYASLKTKLLFDPPSNTVYIESYINELEARIRYATDKFDEDDLVLAHKGE